jgi:hypothetical protein
MNRSKARGTAWESSIVTYLAQFWPHVERRVQAGANDKGDIAGIPGVVIEAKNCQRIELAGWLKEAETERDNAGEIIGAVWAKRKGKSSAGDGYVVMSGATFAHLLQEAGY